MKNLRKHFRIPYFRPYLQIKRDLSASFSNAFVTVPLLRLHESYLYRVLDIFDADLSPFKLILRVGQRSYHQHIKGLIINKGSCGYSCFLDCFTDLTRLVGDNLPVSFSD